MSGPSTFQQDCTFLCHNIYMHTAVVHGVDVLVFYLSAWGLPGLISMTVSHKHYFDDDL